MTKGLTPRLAKVNSSFSRLFAQLKLTCHFSLRSHLHAVSSLEYSSSYHQSCKDGGTRRSFCREIKPISLLLLYFAFTRSLICCTIYNIASSPHSRSRCTGKAQDTRMRTEIEKCTIFKEREKKTKSKVVRGKAKRRRRRSTKHNYLKPTENLASLSFKVYLILGKHESPFSPINSSLGLGVNSDRLDISISSSLSFNECFLYTRINKSEKSESETKK